MNAHALPVTARVAAHRGPHTGMLALLYTVLFCVGLFPVIAVGFLLPKARRGTPEASVV